jgi:hypothetical protein
MLDSFLSQLSLRLLSATLGGYGIFCLIMSFAVPWLGAQAFLLLGAATAIFGIVNLTRSSQPSCPFSFERGSPIGVPRTSLHRTAAPPTAGGYHPCLT